ncbi:hypothetical protein I4U23_017653 [Adineta vaga]|nr:hypothetical protein I4U23_017653 [Adineta vaga]
MASLFRNTRSILSRLSYVHRTATTTTATAGTQVKTSGTSAQVSPPPRSTNGNNLAVRDVRQRSNVSDPIRPRAAGGSTTIPLVGTALNTSGQMVLGLFLAISVYFIYINYITNPEFYKSLKISREASKQSSQEHSAQ